MTCPSCGGELDPARSTCPVCAAGSTPRVEGALAADPRYVTPQPRVKVEPLRDIPGLRKREKTWRDEVQERMKSRRQKRASAGLPLFDEVEAEGPKPAPPRPPEAGVAAAASGVEPRPSDDFVAVRLTEAELGDLPLNTDDAAAEAEARAREASALPRATRRPMPSLDEDALVLESDAEKEGGGGGGGGGGARKRAPPKARARGPAAVRRGRAG